MKRFTVITVVLLLCSGTASAQASPLQGGLLGALLGPEGVVRSLIGSAQQGSLQPTFDALAARHPEVNAPLTKFGEDPLIAGDGGQDLNLVLSALLTNNTGSFLNLPTALEGVAGLLIRGPNGGALGGLAGVLIGSNSLISNFSNFGGGLMGASLLTGTGHGMSASAIPLNDIAPGTQAALVNGAKLPGL